MSKDTTYNHKKVQRISVFLLYLKQTYWQKLKKIKFINGKLKEGLKIIVWTTRCGHDITLLTVKKQDKTLFPHF